MCILLFMYVSELGYKCATGQLLLRQAVIFGICLFLQAEVGLTCICKDDASI